MDKYLQIKELFESNRDDENSIKMSKYMRDKFKYYGIPTPKRKSLYKDLLKSEKKNNQIDWEFLDRCYEDEHREFQYLVLDYLATMKNLLTYDDVSKIKKYVKAKQWWDTIDGLDTIIGSIESVDERINDLMLEWSTNEDFWMRRIAIDHQLCRKHKTNTELLEKILVNNFGSTEFFINKAIGWSLREYSKVNPEWVREFLAKYGDSMSNLSVREASKRI